MGFGVRALATLLKLVPLGIYVRSVLCKTGVPVLGCDAPLCPVAIGQEPVDDCFPTANTAEVKVWCEHGWTPWLNGLLQKAGAPPVATCTEADGFVLLKVVAATEAVGYVLLWITPQFGSFFLSVFMGFALHFHVRHLKEPMAEQGLQWTLFFASLAVLYLEVLEDDTGEAAKPKVDRLTGKPKAKKTD